MGSRSHVRILRDHAHQVVSKTLAGAGTVSYSATGTTDEVYASAPNLRIDPGGSTRVLVMPAEAGSVGVHLRITNTADGAEDLTIRNNADDTTVGTIAQNETGSVMCDGTAWSVAVDKTT